MASPARAGRFCPYAARRPRPPWPGAPSRRRPGDGADDAVFAEMRLGGLGGPLRERPRGRTPSRTRHAAPRTLQQRGAGRTEPRRPPAEDRPQLCRPGPFGGVAPFAVLVEDDHQGAGAHHLGQPQAHRGVGAAEPPLQGDHVQPRCLGVGGEDLPPHQHRGREPVGLWAHRAFRLGAEGHVAQGLVDDLVGLVEHRVLLGPVPEVLVVVDVVSAVGRAVVDALQRLEALARHMAEPRPPQQLLQTLQVRTTPYPEVAQERAGHVLRVGGMPGEAVVQQAAAEALERPRHESSLFPVKRSYISTMKRLAPRESRPSGRVPTRNAGSVRTYW